MVTNIPTRDYDDPSVETSRRAAEYRGQWIYYLLKAMRDHGFDYETIGRKAIFALGRSNKEGFPDNNSAKDFANALLAPGSAEPMQIEPVSVEEDKAQVTFGYCPMCNIWQKLTDDQDFIANLCDIAMDVDRGLLSTYDRLELVLDGGRISAGHCRCDFAVKKTTGGGMEYE
ncbi:L-2-amino-thiazoline-4-carboxylic acid hydrolase [Diplocloster hominis]|uniref:L-2-amino-thiazoline-4-carboxylic acid hydrolase n=1 Tax=Diplocloster hominis TaxID=3079010 RepID=UPI0031BB0903